MRVVLGVDIGGSGVKGAPVDLSSGELQGKRHRIKTPQPSTPQAVAEVVAEIAAFHDWRGPVGVAIPGVVTRGVVRTAANIDDGWIDLDADELLGARLATDVMVLNDADAAGLAEVAFGAGRGVEGVVVLLTFGTGIGSAVVHNGTLLPNTEFGHLEFHGMPAEHYAASRLAGEEGGTLTRDEWVDRVNEYLAYVERLFCPDRFIIGGGISKAFEEYGDRLVARATIVPAELRNNAGIVGAALAAGGRTRG